MFPRAAERDAPSVRVPPLADPPLRSPGVWILYGFTAVTLVGYGTFGLHPELLAEVPQFAGLYAFAFRLFAVTHVWLAGGVVALFLRSRVRARWLAAFGALYLISLASELLGATYGLPFSECRHSPLLDPMWLGRVPVIIPVSWFFMALPSYALATGPDASALRLPARNEAETLRDTLPRLLALSYPYLEILVPDDRSGDGTAAVIECIAAGDPRLRLLRAEPLPEGGWERPGPAGSSRRRRAERCWRSATPTCGCSRTR